MSVKTVIIGVIGGALFFVNTHATAMPIERLTFSLEEFQHFGISAEPGTQKSGGLWTLLCRLFAITDSTLVNETGALDCRSLEQYVALTDVRRLDLNQDGIPDFVALINDPSMASPNGILTVYSLKAEWAAQLLNTYRAEIDETVVDVNRDGRYELCVKSILGDLGFWEQNWVDVYAWDGDTYVESDVQFVDSFYRQRYLPRLATRLEEASEMVRNGERRATISAMLQDCRTALERVAALSTSTVPQSKESLAFAHELDGVNSQIESIQTVLRQEGQQDEIRAALDQTRQTLQQLASAPEN